MRSGQQPRHPRRRAGAAVRHHRHRLRHARRQGGRAAAGAGGAADLRHGPAQLRHHAAGALRSRSTARRRPISASRSRRSARRSPRCSTARELGKYYVGGDAISVRAQAPDGMIDDPGDLENVFVRTGGGTHGAALLLRHRDGARGRARAAARGPAARRADQRHAAPGVDLRQAMNALEAIAADASRPATWASAISARRRR